MANAKLGRPSKERDAMLSGLVSDLFWFGKVETTVARGKSAKRIAERLLTKAINAYEDIVKVEKTIDGVKTVVTNDGPKKLQARRALMAYLQDRQEQKQPKESPEAFAARTKDIKHPLLEKIFNVYAPKYAARAKELGQGGGYTRLVRIGTRRGDVAEMCIVTLI